MNLSVLWINTRQTTSVFLGLPHPIVLGISKSVTDLIEEVAPCTCPYHLSCRLRRTAVMSTMPSFWSSEAEGVSSQSLVSQIQRIMVVSLWCRSEVFEPDVSQPWSIAKWTQASYTLPRTLRERCLVVRTGKSFLNFPKATQHLAAMALLQPPPEHSTSPRS